MRGGGNVRGGDMKGEKELVNIKSVKCTRLLHSTDIKMFPRRKVKIKIK